MIGDELEQLRRANPVQDRTGEWLAAPHAAAFRESIETAPNRRARLRSAKDAGPKREYRLVLVAAAVALVALPGVLLVRDNPSDVILRTPTTEGSAPDDDQAMPTTTDDAWIEPTVSTSPDSEDALGVVGHDAPAPTTTADTDSPSTTQPDVAASPSTAATAATNEADSGASSPASTTPASVPAPVVPTESGDDDADTAAAPPVAASAPPTTSPTTVAANPPVTTTATTTPTTEPPAQRSLPAFAGPFDPATDLLMVTFDFAHLDDGHATAATRELADEFSFVPVVVAGTSVPESGQFTHDYSSAMSAAWADGWLDAGADRAAAVADVTQRWLSIIDGGGEVWVAEGGVSDFTGAVLADVRAQRPGLDTRAVVHVIHHIGGNLDGTQSAERQMIETHADIVRIDDGNNVNGTAGLLGASAGFEAAALAGQSAPMWTSVFDYFSASSLDFSDTVTVLHALGVGTDLVADPDDFATAFMS